jgi:hypothetical protein
VVERQPVDRLVTPEERWATEEPIADPHMRSAPFVDHLQQVLAGAADVVDVFLLLFAKAGGLPGHS